MQRYRDDLGASEVMALQTLLEDVTKRLRERNAVGVFQMMNNLTEGMAEQQSGSGEVEEMITPQAETAKALDCRRRLAASGAERRFERNQVRPAFRTCPSPPALLNWSMTLDTRDW